MGDRTLNTVQYYSYHSNSVGRGYNPQQEDPGTSPSTDTRYRGTATVKFWGVKSYTWVFHRGGACHSEPLLCSRAIACHPLYQAFDAKIKFLALSRGSMASI